MWRANIIYLVLSSCSDILIYWILTKLWHFKFIWKLRKQKKKKINRIFSLSDCCKLLAEECRWERWAFSWLPKQMISLILICRYPDDREIKHNNVLLGLLHSTQKRFKMEKLKPEEIQMVGTIYVEQQRPFQLRNWESKSPLGWGKRVFRLTLPNLDQIRGSQKTKWANLTPASVSAT